MQEVSKLGVKRRMNTELYISSVDQSMKTVLNRVYSFLLQPPRIGGIKTYTHNVDRNEIIMDIDLM